jgi:L-asparaginase
MVMPKSRIAVFSGSNATIQNSPALVTSNQARLKYGLPLKCDPDGSPTRFDVLRPQRLAAPVTVYIEQFSAHPLERDAAELYAPPDGYVDSAGVFHRERQGPADVPVYEVTLRPEDGLYPLPYLARQANGQPWEEDGVSPDARGELTRQPFYPDASRLFEEIDRFGLSPEGWANQLSSRADYDFYRAAPPGGYTRGLPAAERTDVGQGDLPPELRGRDFFPYRPPHLGRSPTRATLAMITNLVQSALASRAYSGAIWLQGSPRVEETAYWFNLLIDTAIPIVGVASQRVHGSLGNEGDHNIVEAVHYLTSRVWADSAGQNAVGCVLVQDERVFAAREVQKVDARPGGYTATGGHGGVVGNASLDGPPVVTFLPTRRHTYTSALNLTRLASSVIGVRRDGERIGTISVQTKDAGGGLLPGAIPAVSIVKDGNYVSESFPGEPDREVDILARLDQYLRETTLSGFVAEGLSPYGTLTSGARDTILRRAVCSGLPVVTVGRGNNEGFTRPRSIFIGGNNLTSTKARLLLMAALLGFGALPPAADPDHPTEPELTAIKEKLAEYQQVFDTH